MSERILDETVVVNLYGGPGTGKSTTASGIFYELNREGIVCEMAREYAKDIVWRENFQELDDQLFIFAEQRKRVRELLGKVDVVITDSPLLLSTIYGNGEANAFQMLVWEEYNKLNNLDILLHRDPNRDFIHAGRVQNRDRAQKLDFEIRTMFKMLPDGHQVMMENVPTEVCLTIIRTRLQELTNGSVSWYNEKSEAGED